MKNGLPSVRSITSRLSGASSTPLAQKCREHCGRAFLAQRIEPQLRVVALVGPLMPVLGAVIEQQQHSRVRDALGQKVKQLLRLTINPMQVFKDHDERLIQTFAQEDAFDGLQRAPKLNLRVHLRDWVGALMQSH